jgi:methylenetetrahydrofolate dehydrogenase (NADP+) / methenyltetrahydrofolate cyclohydrolase
MASDQTAKILEGKTLGLKILEELKGKLKNLSSRPALAIIQVGDKEESSLYIKRKKEFGEKAGFLVQHLEFSYSVTQENLIEEIEKLNQDNNINGIIVQLPLPNHLDFFEIIESIDPSKDVDGLHSKNFRKLIAGNENGLVPATAKGVLNILDFYKILVSGKNVVVIGRSVLVGRPIALLLSGRNATVTVAHSHTENLEKISKSADILVVAIGVPKKINKNFVSEGQIIIDVGINSVSGGKLQEEVQKRGIVGDVDFEEVKNIVSAITPVPGGIGPMTVSALFQNVLKAYELQKRKI